MLTLAASEEVAVIIPIIAIGGGLFVGLVATISSALRKAAQSRHAEESRREIAAYVAEGSISADDAAKLLMAGRNIKDRSCD